MNFTPRNLNILLKKSGHFGFWLFLACVAFATFTIKPNTVASWAVTLILVAPTFWFGFFGPASLDNWTRNHRYVFAGWLVFALKLAILVMIIKFVAPVAISFLAGLHHV